MQTSVRLAFGAAFVVALIFAGHYLVAKVVLQAVPPLSLAASRGLAGGLALLIVFQAQVRAHLSRRRILILVAVAALGFCCNQLLLLGGLARTTPADAALVSSTIPMMATALAVVTGVDRLSWRRLSGVLLGFAVVGWYLFQLDAVDLGGHVVGNLMILANVACFCLALIVVKRFLADVPPEVITTMMLLLGGFGLWLVGGGVEPVAAYAISSIEGMCLMVFELLITTALGYTLNLWVLKRLSVAATTVFNYLQLPMTASIGWFLWNDEPSEALLFAFAGVLFACLLVTSREGETA